MEKRKCNGHHIPVSIKADKRTLHLCTSGTQEETEPATKENTLVHSCIINLG